ncbi:protein TIC 22-like, chloroplastic isoform X1 [Carica papaya]|uniref:protein TIC 22-like, chloroplastic isoform X1 n=1 Tax=Carica papaya TaxID=3649 RepID=UPI000B8CBC6E|nr:protein TIC 22-like, chloroplastic isoform X1 [Carica papaya]
MNQSSKQQLQLNIHQVFTNIQTHCSGFLHNLSQNLSLSNPNPSSLHSQFLSNLSVLQNEARQAFGEGFSHLNLPRHTSGPVWARIADNGKAQVAPVRQSGASMSDESIEERLAGVPVYALSNSDEEFVLVSGVSTKKSLGLLCFKKEDAEVLLQQMKSMDPGMRKEGSKVVAIALNKVFQLKLDGVAFRLIPESAQVKNAIKPQETSFPLLEIK